MNNINTNQLADEIRIQNLSSFFEVSPEKVQDLQAAFSLMDSQSKGYVCPNDIIRVAEAAGSAKNRRKNNIRSIRIFYY